MHLNMFGRHQETIGHVEICCRLRDWITPQKPLSIFPSYGPSQGHQCVACVHVCACMNYECLSVVPLQHVLQWGRTGSSSEFLTVFLVIIITNITVAFGRAVIFAQEMSPSISETA